MIRKKKIFFASFLSLLVIAVFAGAFFSKHYWGYWFTRPSPLVSDTAVQSSSLFFRAEVLGPDSIRLNFFNAEKARETFAKHCSFCSDVDSEYLCLIARAFKSNQLLFTEVTALFRPAILKFLKSEVRKGNIFESTGEDPSLGNLDGLFTVLEDSGSTYHYFAMIGGEYGSDSYPYYEYLIEESGGERVKEFNFFWFEKAGI